MPRNISPEMKAHIAGEVTSLCTLWDIVRKDGVQYGFTDHDMDVIYEGMVYESALGYTPSAVDTNGALNVDTQEMKGILSTQTISDSDLTAGRWDYAFVTCMTVNYNDLSMGPIYMRCGHLGEVKTGRGEFTAELRGLSQNIQQTLGETYTGTCQANLGDARCKVDLSPITFAGAVSSVTSRSVFSTTLGDEDGNYAGGLISWTSGANIGLKMEIKDSFQAGGLLSLQQRMPYAVVAGDEFMAQWGCDKLPDTCDQRYENIINFRGFNLIPGADLFSTGKS